MGVFPKLGYESTPLEMTEPTCKLSLKLQSVHLHQGTPGCQSHRVYGVLQSRGRRDLCQTAVQGPEVSTTGQGFCISGIIRSGKLPTKGVRDQNSSANRILLASTLACELKLYGPGSCGSKQRGSGFVGGWARSSITLLGSHGGSPENLAFKRRWISRSKCAGSI